MKRTIERLTRAAMLAVAFMLCATGQVCAADSLAQTGGFVTTSSQLAFKDVTLSQIVDGTYVIKGRMSGGSVNRKGAEIYACMPYTKLDDSDNIEYVRYELQMDDNGYVKCVIVKLTQNGSDVNIQATAARYSSGSIGSIRFQGESDGGDLYGTSANNAANATADGYVICGLRLVAANSVRNTRSININFYYSTQLSSEYLAGSLYSSILCGSWDNVQGAATIEDTSVNVLATNGEKSTADGVKVAVSGGTGKYYCSSVNGSTNIQQGYLDDGTDGSAATVTVKDIPFNYYKVIVYHAVDNQVPFGYDTINGTNYRGATVDGLGTTVEGTASWGSSGASHYAKSLEEGVNYLVSPVFTKDDFPNATIVSHCSYTDGNWDYRSGICAVQIVEVPDRYRWFNYASGVYAWNGSAAASGAMYKAGGLKRVYLDGSYGEPTAANNEIHYTKFAKGVSNSEWSAPGCAVFFNESGKYETMGQDHNPLSIGGLYVTEVASEGHPYKYVNGTTSGDRSTELGDPTANSTVETWFVFEKDFAIERSQATKFFGNVNLMIDTDATFSNNVSGCESVLSSGATLRMYGEGQMAVSTLNAAPDSGTATLNFSNLPASPDQAFIRGGLKVGSATRFAFPAGLAEDTSFPLCTGTLTAPDRLIADINVGSETFKAILVFDTTAKTVKYLNNVLEVTLDAVSGTDITALSWSDTWSVNKGLEITVDSASSIAVASATTVDTLKIVGSADLTIAGIENLTLSAFDLSEYTGKLIIDGSLPASIKLCGGALVFDIAAKGTAISGKLNAADAYQGDDCDITGTGDVYKRGAGSFFFNRGPNHRNNNNYVGDTYIEVGVARRWQTNSFGASNNNVYVRDGGVIDLVDGWGSSNQYVYNLAGSGNGAFPAMCALNSANLNHSVMRINLDADATIAGDKDITLGKDQAAWTIYLHGHKLTKVGSGTFSGKNIHFADDGIFEIAGGTFNPTQWNSGGDGAAKLVVFAGATVSTYYNSSADDRCSWYDVENNGTISIGGDSENNLYVRNSYSGVGSVNRLKLAASVTLKPTSVTTGMAVTDALTLVGTINIDISSVDLTGKCKLPIITGPSAIDKDNKVAALTRGSNSLNWDLYSEEVVEDTTYALGVYLTTIVDSVSWTGDSGTWSVNSFNGGTENYSNQALQTVTFADDAGSSATPLAVTVSGAKTVNALNFTADNRNITLSGDAITADTVSKSGDGVAIINNDLSVATSISVTDGVLVLNPNGEEVSDVDSLDDGTLVVYVGSGVTRTVTESIIATKLVKRGTGTLDLTAIAPSMPIIVDDGKVVVDEIPSSNVTINLNGTFTLKNVSWTSGATLFSGGNLGSGTLELYNSTSGHMTHTVTGVTFDGTLDFISLGTNGHIINNTGFLAAGNTPQLAINTTGTSDIYCHLFFHTSFNNTTFAVRDLTGSGSLCAKYSGGTAQTQTIQTTQTMDSVFSGNMVCNDEEGNAAHTVNLAVVGDGTETTHSLTIRGTNSSIGALGVGAYTKVIFDGSGSWLNGATTVAANGVLESQRDAQVVGALTLNEGAVLSYGNSSEAIQAGSLTLPASGTVTVDASALTIDAADSKVLLTATSGAAFNVSKFTLTGTSTHVLSKSGDRELSLVPIAATLTYTVGNVTTVTPYATVEGAVSAAYTKGISGYDYITAYQSATVATYATSVKTKLSDGVILTITSESGEYNDYTAGAADANGIITYTTTPKATTYVWTDNYSAIDYQTYVSTPNHNWTVPPNWNVQGGTTASRYPQAGDTVVFNDGATVTLDATATVAGVVVNGAVSISGTAVSLNSSGNITGSGTLTLSDVCLASSASGITVAPAINFTNDSELAGNNPLTLNGAVTITGLFKIWDSVHIISGAVTISSGATVQTGTTNGNGGALMITGTTRINGSFNKSGDNGLTLGAVTVASSAVPTITNAGSISLTGAVTVANGATFTIPASNVSVGESASFVLAGRSAVLQDNTSGASGKVSTSLDGGARVVVVPGTPTIYKVGYGTIFSVY